MKKEIFFITLILVLSFITGVPYPHAFEGNVIVESLENPTGYILIGKVNGIATGSAVIESDGKYSIVVSSEMDRSNKITFYIGEEKSEEEFIMVPLEITKTNLTFQKLSEVGSCGNNVCDAGECSSCPVDCKLTECKGNGVCDSEVGENCLNTPEDCGFCVSCGDGICNGEETCSNCEKDCGKCSSSSSGGGGGSSGSFSTNEEYNSDENEESNSNVIPIEELNEKFSKESKISGITGATIGFINSGAGIATILGFIILVSGIIVLIKKKSY